ncbi:carbonic anhydrase [Chelativorans sp. Marseille-P2723]|uniref:carbonic anhydrase n=1 Tax=Chelativorans sp. Marseille-P2723 TaxID=2709133 RepID=UPI00156DC0DD|nr:carbonic anhydrase [Chelativorans sp. Marseille-P2723]
MKRRHFIRGLIAAGACPICTKTGLAGAHWTYGGEAGPEHWGELDPDNLACSAGMQQSPVDISGDIEADLPDIALGWKPGRGVMVNNGHTIQINMVDGGTLSRGEESYELLQFHFHAPSEHSVRGQSFPMEVHFVHKNPRTGSLEALGIFLVPGRNNETFRQLAEAFPKEQHGEASFNKIDPSGLLPATLEYWLYAGSLTTPPCSEDVVWMVAREPVEVNGADIDKFTAIYSMNARPIRRPNRRFILTSD